MHFKKEKSYINDISLYTTIANDDDGHELTLRDKIPISDEEIEEENETAEKVNIKDSTSNLTQVGTASIEKEKSKVKQVRDYILSMDHFTTKELKRHFPNLTSVTINNAIQLAKKKGLITATNIGEYEGVKN